MIERWEYKIVQLLSVHEKDINELGAEGWELKHIVNDPDIDGSTGTLGYFMRRLAIWVGEEAQP